MNGVCACNQHDFGDNFTFSRGEYRVYPIQGYSCMPQRSGQLAFNYIRSADSLLLKGSSKEMRREIKLTRLPAIAPDSCHIYSEQWAEWHSGSGDSAGAQVTTMYPSIYMCPSARSTRGNMPELQRVDQYTLNLRSIPLYVACPTAYLSSLAPTADHTHIYKGTVQILSG